MMMLTVLLSMISIQFGASLAKPLFAVVGASGVTCFRTGFAALILCLAWQPWRRAISRKDFKTICVYGVALGLMNLLFYKSIERIPLGITVAIEFIGPLTYAALQSHKKIHYLWVLLAAIGIGLMLPASHTATTSMDTLGVIYALSAGLFWGLYLFFGKKASGSAHGGVATSVGMFVAAVVTIPFYVFDSTAALPTATALPMLFAISVLSSALPYSLEMISLKRISGRTYGILLSLAPAIAALSGFLFMGEVLTSLQWVAIMFIVSASIGSTLKSLS
jgi:inner membrane transporter RhtA